MLSAPLATTSSADLTYSKRACTDSAWVVSIGRRGVDCREEELPEAIKHKKSVRKGTVLVFTRDQAGLLAAKADQHDLIAVHSKPLCDAIFDLYIGDQPVSKKAKRMTGESFVRLVGAEEYCAPREPLVCEGAGPACQL